MHEADGDVLARELNELKARVDVLERYLGLGAAAGAALPDTGAAAPQEGSSTADLLPEAGRALLGLAGAYLLRALAEGGTLPVRAGVAIGIAYAMAWLVAAARTPAEQRLRAALRSLTSVLVLSPLLWEAAIRFGAVPPFAAGIILLAFTIFGLAISWRKNLLVIATIATLAGVGTAFGLMIASRDVLTFTGVLVAIAAAVEISACLDHWLNERWLAALAADLAVLFATALAGSRHGVPEGYAPIPHGPLLAAQVALVAVYLTSTMVRTLFRGIAITWFETAQCAAAIALIIGAALGPVVGVATLIFAAACYVVSFAVLERGKASVRNFFVYSTFGILLATVGTRILLPSDMAVAAWLLLAVAAAAAGVFFERGTLLLHGTVYLLFAAVVSGALAEGGVLLLGISGWPAPSAALLGTTAAAAVCYALAGHSGSAVFRLALAIAAFWFGAAAVAGALTAGYHAALGSSAAAGYCAAIRTAVLVILALVSAWAGARWQRSELRRLAYPAIILAGYRLLTIDLREEGKAPLMLSLLAVGAALTILPRLRAGKPARTAAASSGG